ncbi:VOC family protein [Mucilaginibacter defluvii]|uniref:VOC family protein n=1 Tax=Mucilaginibacter defluvii TaxID=1196019 RepID=A0ABP9FRM6_9SPHI
MSKNLILGLRTAIYKVPDLEAAKNWYAQVFNTQPYFDEVFYVGFNIGGYELGLQPDERKVGDNTVIYWGVENAEGAYADFLAAGATSFEEPQNVGGDIVVATVKDPWGNVIGLIYNPHFKAV